MKSESLLKASILSHGINFSHRALNLAKAHNAKGQNGCYNLPGVKDTFSRPQELFLVSHRMSIVPHMFWMLMTRIFLSCSKGKEDSMMCELM